MAILCLSKDIDDLRRRIEKIILGYNYDNTPFTVKDLGIAGSIVVLLKDAINPNLVQTTEHNAAIVHGGPFANIAHGCNSIIATKVAMSHADYVVTEAGFGADLGAEKFFNIKCRKAGLTPKLTVIVATAQGLKMHGGVAIEDIKKENIEGLRNGLANIEKHISNMQSFGQTVIVAFNKYAQDTQAELDIITDFCKSKNIGFAINNAFSEGGEGAMELANLVVGTIENNPSKALAFTYEDNDSIQQKVEKIAEKIYGADAVEFSGKVLKILQLIKGTDIEKYPVCIAKTQYSFSEDPKAYGVAKGFTLTINDMVINNGAEFIVAIAGTIMRMPGLPKAPQANHIDIVDGLIDGLS